MRFILILLLTPLTLLSQSTFDLKVLNQEFLEDINQYRISNGVHPLQIDTGLSPFVIEHCEFMANEVGVTHGELTNYSFQNRWYRFISRHRQYIPIQYRGEILLSVFVPENGTGDSGGEGIVNQINKGECGDDCISQHMIENWKSSSSHNEALLDKEFTHLYLGAYRKGHVIYGGVIFVKNF
jgi:uncharacterized protein YkwD